MKKTTIILSAVFLLGLASHAARFDFTYTGTDQEGHWTNSSHWTSSEIGLPSAEDDVYIQTTGADAGLRVTGGVNIFAGNLTIGGDVWDIWTLEKSEIENLPAVGDYSGPSLRVTYDFTMEKDGLRFGSGEYRRGFRSVYVGNDLNIGTITMGFEPNHTYWEGDPSLAVAGRVNLYSKSGDGTGSATWIVNKCGNINTSATEMAMVYVNVGGLNASNGVIANNDPGALKTTLTFISTDGKQFSGGDFTGSMVKWYNDSYSDFAILMDDTSDGGQQILRLVDPEDQGNTYRFDNFTATVRNGKLGIYTSENSRFDLLTISGGELSVENSASTGVHDGNIKAVDINWTGGKIRLDVTDTYNDVVYAENMTGNGIYEFIFDYEGDFESIINKDILFVSDDYSGITLDMFSGKTSDDLYDAIFAWENGTLTLVGLVIPEPSSYGLIMGIASVGLIVTRRRKR